MFIVLTDFVDKSLKYGNGYIYDDDLYVRILDDTDYEMEVITRKELLNYIPKFSESSFYNIRFDPIVGKYFIKDNLMPFRPRNYIDKNGILKLDSNCELNILSRFRINLTVNSKVYSFSYLNYSLGFILFDRFSNFSIRSQSLRDESIDLSTLNQYKGAEIDCSSIYFYKQYYLVLNIITPLPYNILSIIFSRKTGDLLFAKSLNNNVILSGVSSKINLLDGLEWH